MTKRYDAEEAQRRQAQSAIAQLHQYGTAIEWPWTAMDTVLGPIQKGTVHFLCSPPGNGKTTMAGSLILGWLQAGITIVSGWFEQDPGSARRYLAAMTLGLNPGDVLGGEYEKHPEFRPMLDALVERVREMEQGLPPWDQLHLIEHDHVSQAAIREMGDLANAYSDRPTLVIVDHCDHLGPDGANGYGASSNAVYSIHAHAKAHDSRWLCFSQVNNRELSRSGTLLPRHRALPFSAVSNGQTKEQCAWTMTGIYRPLKPDITTDEVKAVVNDSKLLKEVLWPGVTMCNVMKHRHHGERVGEKILLGWEHGKLVDAPEDVKRQQEAKTHGIKTAPTPY